MDIKSCLNRNLKDWQSIPFWSWNDKLQPEHLREQIQNMKKAGIGGFFMHARGGLMTEYLSDEWFDATGVCIDEARKQGMDAWCYDENGWPSGFAGMKLLEDPANHEYYLVSERVTEFDPSALACYTLKGADLVRVFEGAADLALYTRQNSSVVDILNPEIVRKFLDETHERYYDRFGDDFGKVMAGFFTDEPQYFRYDTAYTPLILPLYTQRYGADLLDTLGALFTDCRQSNLTRYRYWLLMNELYTENFAGQIYRWCEAHNCQLTGHSIEESSLFGQMMCCAGIMPFYEYEQKPGIDWLCRDIGSEMSPRQLSSVAQQLGKEHCITETFACCGWDVTPRELKRIAEWQYVNGVNQMCQHLYPYSIRGQRKRDYPAFYSEHSPWAGKFEEFKHFNDYFTDLGYMLSQSKEAADVAVIHPIHSAYFTFDRNNGECTRALEDSFSKLIETLGAAQICHHYVDEHLLAKYGTVRNGKLVCGRCSYGKVVLPDMVGLDSTTLTLLRKFVAQGGKLYLAGQTPSLVDGAPAEVDLTANIGFEDLRDADCTAFRDDTEIRSTLRRADFGDFLYAVNLSESKCYEVPFRVKATGAHCFMPGERTEKPFCYSNDGDYICFTLALMPGESIVLMLNGGEAEKPAALGTLHSVSGITAVKTGGSPNTFTVDYAALSYDGVSYTEPVFVMAISDRLLRERTNRTVYVKYTFDAEYIPADLKLEAEKMNARSVTFNGTRIELNEAGTFDSAFAAANIAALAKLGKNEIVFEIDYYQTEHVYNVFNGMYYDGADGTETLINCLSYVTDIEAVYLRGDFGVKSGPYTPDRKLTFVTDGPFVLTKPETAFPANRLAEHGYPFFGGEMTFTFDFDATGAEQTLTLNGRFAVAKLKVNGADAGMLMLTTTANVAGLLKPGKNTAEVTLISGYRNVFGPFHEKDPEPFGVGPDTFSRYGSWKDGKSDRFVSRYAFVAFGIDGIDLY